MIINQNVTGTWEMSIFISWPYGWMTSGSSSWIFKRYVIGINTIDHKTSKCGDTLVLCSYHILMSSVINYWTDAQQHRIYLLLRTCGELQFLNLCTTSFSLCSSFKIRLCNMPSVYQKGWIHCQTLTAEWLGPNSLSREFLISSSSTPRLPGN